MPVLSSSVLRTAATTSKVLLKNVKVSKQVSKVIKAAKPIKVSKVQRALSAGRSTVSKSAGKGASGGGHGGGKGK